MSRVAVHVCVCRQEEFTLAVELSSLLDEPR